MKSVADIKKELTKEYEANGGFFKLLSPESFPKKIPLKIPASKDLLAKRNAILQWRSELESSVLGPYLQLTTRRLAGGATSNLPEKVVFTTRDEFESFVAPQNCPYPKKVVDYFASKDLSLPKAHKGIQDHFLAGAANAVVDDESLKNWCVSAPLGSFRAFEDICSLVINPRHPNLKVDSDAYKQRLNGLKVYLEKHAKEVALLGSKFVLAMQVVDYLASLDKTPNIYCRQIALPNMDTKFMDLNRSMIDELLLLCLPESRQLDRGIFIPSVSELNDDGDSFDDLEKASEDDAREASCDAASADFSESEVTDGDDSDEKVSGEDSDASLSSDKPLDDAANAAPASNKKLPRRCRNYNEFALRWGFKQKPTFFRVRFLDPKLNLSIFNDGSELCEMHIELNNLANLKVDFKHIIICENEISYLSMPPISNTIAIFGHGFSASQLASLPQMHDRDVIYWGDIDYHGFMILNNLRVALSRKSGGEVSLNDANAATSLGAAQVSAAAVAAAASSPNSLLNVRSMFMDEATLQAYRGYMVKDNNKKSEFNASMLAYDELSCFKTLMSNKFGEVNRLEQELIAYDKVLVKLKQMLPDETIIEPDNICQLSQ